MNDDNESNPEGITPPSLGSRFTNSGQTHRNSQKREDPNNILGQLQFKLDGKGHIEDYIELKDRLVNYARNEGHKDMARLIKSGTEKDFPEPVCANDGGTPPVSTDAQMEKYKHDLSEHAKDKKEYNKSKTKYFGIIFNRCSKPLKAALETLTEFEAMDDNDDIPGLLKAIETLLHGNDGKGEYKYRVMARSMQTLINNHQYRSESVDDYYDRFMLLTAGAEQVWGKLIPSTSRGKGKSATDQEAAREQFLACLFLAGANRQQFESVVASLHNQYTSGIKDAYPKTVHDARNYLKRYVQPSKKSDNPPRQRDSDRNNNNQVEQKGSSAPPSGERPSESSNGAPKGVSSAQITSQPAEQRKPKWSGWHKP